MTEAELQELIIPKGKLEKHKNVTLGRGGYGYVCLGTLTHEDGDLEKVAIKVMITEGNVPDNIKKCLVKEACKLREVSQHDNIVKLLGVIMEQDNYGLVLELMVFENCLTFINDYAVVWPQNKLLIQICHQVSSAMVYLHRLTPPMLHMDLKGDNILMNQEFDAKICDFGISEWKTRTTRQDRRGTISHVPPEILNNVNIQSKPEQDVYSFGICCWEIFTGKKPYAGKSEEVIKTCVKDGQRPSMTDIGERCPDYMIDVIKRCWHQDPDVRPTFHALQQELDGKCKNLRLQIFKGKKAVRRKIQDKHTLNDIKYIQTNHWDSIEQPADDPDISLDAIPMTPRITRELSHVSVDATPKVQTPVEEVPPVVVKPYKFRLPKWDLTDFDKKVREILRDPLLMEMIISGHADHLHVPQDVVELISSPKLLQKYINEDTDFKLELERSRHPIFDNIHFPKIKDAEQKGVAGQREAKENDVFRYTKYRPTKKESEKTDREKRQEARNRSMQTCSYIGKLHKSGLYQKVVKALKEPHQIKEALNDLETSSGEAEKFSIIGSDVLEALQDPVMMQILFSQDPQALDTFMRYYPELTMKLLASNKTHYRSQGPSYQRRRSREEDPPRSRFNRDPFDRDTESRFDRDPFDRDTRSRFDRDPFDRDPFYNDPFDARSRFNRDPSDSDSDEEMRGMLPDLADLIRMPLLPSMMASGHIDRRLRDMLMADAMRKRQEQHNAVKKDKKMENTNRKEQKPHNFNVSDIGNSERPPNAEAINNDQDNADKNKNEQTEVKVEPMEVSEPKTTGKPDPSKKTVPLSLEASIDEMSIDDTADGVILYSELDRDSEEGKMGVTEAVTKLKNIAQSKVPNLQLRLMEELPVAGKTEFNFIDYILSHFNYIFIYLTPNFKSDTLKHFQSQMCLLDTILNKNWRVIPLMTEKNIPNAPLELQLLKPLQMWNMKSTDAHVVEMFVDIFAKTILFGREKGYATKCPNPNGDENITSPVNPITQSKVNQRPSSNQEGIAVPSQDPVQVEVPGPPTAAVNVSNLKEAADKDVEPSSDEEQDLKKKASKDSENQSFDDQDQSSVPGLHTVTHRHAGGGITKINFIPGANTPNMQIGNKNVMVIGAGGDTEIKVKSKSKKSKENIKLTESEEPVSRDDLDMVCSAIGKDWRRLSRKFGFSDGESDQLYQDFHATGTYEIMYQGMRRWIQKNPKEATKKILAESLHAIERDDLSMQLN